MCLRLHIRVALLWYANKEKYLHKISMFTFTKNFFQAYLIWAPKLDILKTGIPLSKQPKIPPVLVHYTIYLHSSTTIFDKLK